MVVGFKYIVESEGQILNAQIVSSVSIAAITSQLSIISITGMTGETYDTYIYTGDFSLLIRRVDLTYIVTKQMVASVHYETFSLEVKGAILRVETGKPALECICEM